MKNRLWTNGIVLAAVAALGAGLAAGLPAATAQPGSRAMQPTVVGVVDLNRVLDKLQERAVVVQKLDVDAKRRQGQLDELRARAETLDQRLKALPDQSADRSKLREELMELQIQARARKEILEAGAEMEQGAAMLALYRKINDAVSRLAQQQGIDVVLVDDSAALPDQKAQMGLKDVIRFSQDRQVLFVGPKADLTEQVVTLMNNEFNATAGKR